MRKIRITKEGYEKLLQQKKELDATREVAVKELSIARDMGDRSENAAYKSARQKLSGIDRQMRFLNMQIQFAHIVEPRNDGVIDIGSTVTIDDSGKTIVYTVVGGYESDIVNGRISMYSPVGKALLGKRIGDKILVDIPAGKKIFVIKEISSE